MRFNLAASACPQQGERSFDIPVTVVIRPSRGMPGDHSYRTNGYALSRMLRRTTELSGVAIDGFITRLKTGASARLPNVELNDQTLREIGYFVD